MSRWRLLGMLLASLLLISCSPNPGEELLTARRGEADLTLTNAKYLIKIDEGQPLSIYASEVAMYDRTDEAQLTNLTFSRRNEAGQETLSGKANQAETNLKNYDTHLSGAVVIDHRAQQLRIEADSLRWLNDQKQLLAPPDGVATIIYEGTKRIRGLGLSADLESLTFSFITTLEGVIEE